MSEVLLGVISDTHGLVRPEAVTVLQGSDLIIHAGDIGNHGVIDQLRGVAPTFVVRGNNDNGAWAAGLPATEVVEVGELLFYVLHRFHCSTSTRWPPGSRLWCRDTPISRQSKFATAFSTSILAAPVLG